MIIELASLQLVRISSPRIVARAGNNFLKQLMLVGGLRSLVLFRWVKVKGKKPLLLNVRLTLDIGILFNCCLRAGESHRDGRS